MPVTQVDEQRAIIAFDDVLGDAGSYAEFGQPSYREGGVRTLSQAFAAHRQAALDEAAGVAIAEIWIARRIADRITALKDKSDD